MQIPVTVILLIIQLFNLVSSWHSIQQYYNNTNISFNGNTNTIYQKRYQDIEYLLIQYQLQHNIDILQNESSFDFCQRQFVHNNDHITCQHGIGNEFGSFMSSFLSAIIFNRTLVVDQYDSIECMKYITYYDWIPLLSNIQQLAQQHQCEITNKDLDDSTINFRECSEKYLHKRILFIGFEHHNKLYRYLKYLYDDTLSIDSIKRSNLLFKDTLFDYSRLFSYGILQIFGLKFKKIVWNIVNPLLEKSLYIPDSFRLSVHVRHYAIHDNDESESITSSDNDLIKSILKIRNILPKKKACYLYVASEREITKLRLLDLTLSNKELNCTMISINHTAYLDYQSEVIDDHTILGNGILPLADLLLLQHGDYFLGYSVSTYSVLVSNMIALQSLRKGIDDNILYWIEGTITEYYNSNSMEILSCHDYKGQYLGDRKLYDRNLLRLHS